MRLLGIACAVLLAGLAPAGAEPADLDVLLKGVTEVVAPGCIVGPVAVFGEKAFPVMTGRSGKSRLPILAAARFGKGRVVLAGHEGLYGNAERPDQRRLMINTATWLAGDHAKPVRVLVVDHRQMAPVLSAAGFRVTTAGVDQVEARLPETDVLLISGNEFTPKARAGLLEKVAKFIEDGGGYFDSVPGWGWQQLNPALSLSEDFGGNRLSARMGLVIADGMLDKTGAEGFLADRSGLALTHAGAALDALEKHAGGQASLSKGDLAQVSATLTNAAGSVPGDDKILLPRVHALIAGQGAAAVPMPKHPLGLDNPIGRIACVVENVEMHRTPVEKLKANPAAEGFPGAVPADAKRVDRTVEVDTSVPGWHSTGLYAAPGEAIEVTLPASAVSAGLGLRIGSHTDTLWGLDKWSRFPEISYATALKRQTTRFGNPFGGIVYVECGRRARAGKVNVEIKGAVQMPLFVLGKTSLDEWKRIRSYPAPWAELASSKIILTVPATVVRDLEDPDAVMQVWDKGLDAIADLAGIPRERERPERICCDQQISAGYMHSGYPIMTWLDVSATMVNHDRMLSGGAKFCWGFWHELGHNHQSGAWTFAGTGETTNNLFSLYCCEKVSGETVDKSTWLNVARRSQRVQQYFADGAKFQEWCSDPGLSLMFYAQLQQAFGWDAFRKVFADYRAARPGDLPRSDDDKRDQWLVRFSRAVGKNLGPFFTAWGIPTSEKARKSIEELPVWLPPDFKNGIPFTTK